MSCHFFGLYTLFKEKKKTSTVVSSLSPTSLPPPPVAHCLIIADATAVYPPALSVDVHVCISPHVCVRVCNHSLCLSVSSSVSSQHVIAIPWVLLAKPVTKPQDNVPVKTA